MIEIHHRNVGIGHFFFGHLKGLTLAVGIRVLFHRRQCTGSQSGQNDSHALCHCCRFQHGARPVAGDWLGTEFGPKANIVVPEVEHTCTAGRGRVIDFAVISDSLQPFWLGKSHLSTIRRANFTLGYACSSRATPTQVRVRQACFPKRSRSRKTVEEMVLSRKRLATKTKPEEPIKKEVKFCCKAEDRGSCSTSRLQDTDWTSKSGFTVNWMK